MSWHIEASTIESYRDNTLSPASAASLEAHVMACADCRAQIAGGPDTGRAAKNWSGIAERVDAVRRSPLERLLEAIGLREHVVRLLVLTPAFSAAWLGGLALVCGLAVMMASDPGVARGDRGMFAFLVIAPVLPVIGVAIAFSRRTDPSYEITLASPISAFELLVIRAAAVLATSVPMSVLVSLAMPRSGWTAVTWLLPALGLTATTLALGRWLPIRVAAGGLSAVWFSAAFITARSESATQLIVDYPAFRPLGQAAFMALAVIAVVSLAAYRDSLDLRRAT